MFQKRNRDGGNLRVGVLLIKRSTAGEIGANRPAVGVPFTARALAYPASVLRHAALSRPRNKTRRYDPEMPSVIYQSGTQTGGRHVACRRYPDGSSRGD